MTEQTNQTVAQSVIGCLRSAGIRRLYGVPGEDHLRLLHEAEAAGLQYIAARDEGAAALMAAAEAQATGLPGVVITTLAPGLTNALNGVASAYLDHVPMIVICGQHDPDRYSTIVRQGLDNHAVMAPLTKWTAIAGRQIHQLMARVIDTAMAPPAGPVFLELRAGIASAQPNDEQDDWPSVLTAGRTLQNTLPTGEALAHLKTLLELSIHPVVILGGRTRILDAELLAQFAAAVRAPVFTSPAAKGLFCDDQEWFAGVFVNGNIEAEVLNEADCVITVGLDASDYFNVPWIYRAEIVAIEPDASNTEHFLPVRSQIVGDANSLFGALLQSDVTSKSTWTPTDVVSYRRHVDEIFYVNEESFTIPSAILEARRVLPSNTYVAIDAGFGKSLHSLLWAAREPNSCFSAQGLSTMGYAIPAANALKIAFPDRPVVGFLGDGSLLMRATEIGVATQHGVAPIYVAWMDLSLSQIAIKQRRQKLSLVGVDLGEQSCPKIADAFGAVGVDVHTRSEFADALSAALDAKVPTLVGAYIDQTRRDGWFEQLRG